MILWIHPLLFFQTAFSTPRRLLRRLPFYTCRRSGVCRQRSRIRAHPEYLGERHKGENTLPILIKFIDAKKDLSVQVHPTDAFAQEHENGQLGKTEMWYVLDASKDAKLVYGLKQDCTKEEIRKAIANGTVMKYLQKVPIHKAEIK